MERGQKEGYMRLDEGAQDQIMQDLFLFTILYFVWSFKLFFSSMKVLDSMIRDWVYLLYSSEMNTMTSIGWMFKYLLNKINKM